MTPPRDMHGGMRIEVDCRNHHLAAVSAVDETGCVGKGKPLLGCKAAARQHQTCMAFWDGDMQATINGQNYESGSCPIPSVGTDNTQTYVFKDGNTDNKKLIYFMTLNIMEEVEDE